MGKTHASLELVYLRRRGIKRLEELLMEPGDCYVEWETV
jgi:hypothetical protein